MIRIARAPLWLGLTGLALPSLLMAVAFGAFVTQAHMRNAGAYAYGAMVLLAAVAREALRWRRSSHSFWLLDEGVLMRVDGGADRRAPTSLNLGADTTVRAHGPPPRWALQGLTGIAALPRISVRTCGKEIRFGVGLTDEESEEILVALLSSPGCEAANARESTRAAAVSRVAGAIGGRGRQGTTSAKLEQRAVSPRSVSPLTSSKTRIDGVILIVFGLIGAFMWWRSDDGAIGVSAAGVLVLLAVIPALLRLSRTFFAGTYAAQVLHAPARPGETVTIRFSLDRHSPVFEWIDLRLQYVRVQKQEGPRWKRDFATAPETRVIWSGLFRLPLSRLPPGPDEHLDAVFALPADAPPTPAGKKSGESWRLDVSGRTEHGVFGEVFPLLVLPAIDSSETS